jgi:hypothetical protein
MTLLLASLLTVSMSVQPGTAYARVAPLPGGTDADYQLGGERAVGTGVGIVARDRTARPIVGKYNICYVNGFQTQPNQKRFWKRHWNLVLKKNGRAVVDATWGEWLLDIGTPAKRKKLARIIGGWAAGCADKGFQAVEYDNLDSYSRSGRRLQRSDAIAFARLLVRRSHAAGLAAAQKNLADFDGTRVGFDFAVAESCARYDECGRYDRYYGDRVVMVEYRRADFDTACAGYGDDHPVVLRDLALSPTYAPTYC